jgi:Bifunctional DNA primase/polymerase, N-terminal/AAA domain
MTAATTRVDPPPAAHNLGVALRWARDGVAVFPCDEKKKPLVKEDWLSNATTDESQIARWWAEWPDALVATPMKPLGLLAIDCDRHDPAADGVAGFAEVCQSGDGLPAHPVTETAGNGQHHFFRMPAGPIGNRKIAPGIETRGFKADNSGGYCILAGSMMPDGRAWRQANGTPSLRESIRNGMLPVCPQWLADYLRPRQTERPEAPRAATTDKRGEAYATKALDNVAAELASTPSGERNNALNVAAFKMGTLIVRGWIGRATVEGRLIDACHASGLVGDDGLHAVQATIASGITAGLLEPHSDLSERPPPGGNAGRAAGANGHDRDSGGRAGAASPPPKLNARTLQAKRFDPMRYIIPGIIAEGCTLFAGKPKSAKSWLALDLAIAVADGQRQTLGAIKPEQSGDVLFLALDDNERRLQRRMDTLMPPGADWPERLLFATEWRRVDQGGLDDIRIWAASVTKPTLIVVDTLQRVRPPRPANANGYDTDYQALAGLQKLAAELKVTIVVIHHVRKAEAADVFDTISGTLGLTAASDANIVLGKQGEVTILAVQGRDVEGGEWIATFNKASCKWTLSAEQAAKTMAATARTAIMSALTRLTVPVTPAQLAELTGFKPDNVRQTLRRMMTDNDVVLVGTKYATHGVAAKHKRQQPPKNESQSHASGENNAG